MDRVEELRRVVEGLLAKYELDAYEVVEGFYQDRVRVELVFRKVPRCGP